MVFSLHLFTGKTLLALSLLMVLVFGCSTQENGSFPSTSVSTPAEPTRTPSPAPAEQTHTPSPAPTEPTHTPSPTPAEPTHTPSPTPAEQTHTLSPTPTVTFGASELDVQIAADTTWKDIFVSLADENQSCIRDQLGDDLKSILALRLLTDERETPHI